METALAKSREGQPSESLNLEGKEAFGCSPLGMVQGYMGGHVKSHLFHGHPWIILDIDAHPWISMDIQGYPSYGARKFRVDAHLFWEPLGMNNLKTQSLS